MIRTLKFKSNQTEWRKEFLGLKRNTFRVFDTDKLRDKIREDILKSYLRGDINLLDVEMENTRTKEIFTRGVTDVTRYGGGYIISW